MAEAMDVEHIAVDSDGTETGDLDALRTALKDLDIEGVVTGALWSDYQWDRINLVCGDLGLCVISPLWRKDQEEVYDLMNYSGMDAVIVGVFAEGLDGSWLGRHLDMDTKKELLVLRERYGISIMGEGGEYESMTLDSPMHSKKLAILNSNKIMERNTGALDVTEVSLLEKNH
jgi:predicted ATP pyrophosphatase (TIGR00289 family)